MYTENNFSSQSRGYIPPPPVHLLACMPPYAPRTSLSFGLVSIRVELQPAIKNQNISFHWLHDRAARGSSTAITARSVTLWLSARIWSGAMSSPRTCLTHRISETSLFPGALPAIPPIDLGPAHRTDRAHRTDPDHRVQSAASVEPRREANVSV